ncbi:sulfite exporter TauE/SafE family protein [Macrococcoides caseolyticum]|uniref:sulfite exporter TauE/SafE family protein n=1 Tax=Macrococcoides caseolyticum TaxID=69966 RepID=UPI001F196E8A|nr:sulfite exporter TauE/SafE family protein [Macrococcus caseolyticus]MCE4956576.1 sulfite exporter TauE/SafE family protein [Macrococcus caseolyticus]
MAFILFAIISAVGAFLSGLIGIGGAIIMYPMLLFIPPLFNIDMTPTSAAGLTAAQVFFSTLSGSISQRKNDNLNTSIIIPMSIGILLGSISGAYLASIFDESIINIVYTFLAILAVILMFIKVKPNDEQATYNKAGLFIVAGIIGVLSGIVGAGGAFLIVPILLTLFKVPFRVVVANSIIVAFVSSIGTFVTKFLIGSVDIAHAIPLIIASLIFAPLGTKVSKRTNQTVLRYILTTLIILAAVKMIIDMI